MPPAKRPRPGATGTRTAPTEPTAPTPEPEDREPDTTDSDIGNVDRVDAILRDPNCPANVRAFVQDVHALSVYLDTVEFTSDDTGYVTVNHPAPAPASDA